MARVGTAYLQIVASLTGVRKDIQDKLNQENFSIKITPKLTAYRKTIQDELNKKAFDIKLDPKMTGVRTSINIGLKEAFKINLDPNLAGVRTKVETMLRDNFRVWVDVQTRGLRKQVADEFTAPFEIKIEPQLRGLRLAIQRELSRADFGIRVKAVTVVKGGDTDIADAGSTERTNRIVRDNDRAGSSFSRLEQRIAGWASRIRNLATIGNLAGAVARGLALVASVGLAAVSSITALLPVLGALVVAAGAAAAAIMLLPAALGTAAAGIGVLALGFDGVFEAIGAGWKSANVSSSRGAQAQRASAERVADAQTAVGKAVEQRNRTVGDAERDLTRAEVAVGQTVVDVARKVREAQADVGRAIQDRARAVDTAERALTRAQESARDAQERLTRAREDAVERLRDMRGELEDTELGEARAQLGLERAHERLTKVNADTTASALDRREAILDVAEAENRVEDARDASAKAMREQAKAEREGVEGSRAVVDATQDVAEANRRVGDEQADLRRAQTEGTAAIIAAQARVTQVQVEGQQQIGEANQRVGDAQISLQRAQADGALAIAEAQRNLTNAQLQQDATVQTELRNFQEAMARLSPAAQALVNTVLGLKPAFDALQLGVQERLLAGLAGHFQRLAELYLPQLNFWFGLIADSFNRAFVNLSLFFEQTDTQKRFGEAMGNIQRTLDIIAQTVQPIVDLFFTLFVTGSRQLPRLAEGLKGMADRFNELIQGADKSGGLNTFFEAATTNILKILDIVEDLIVSFGAIFNAATVSGGGMLDGIKDVTGAMRDFFVSAEGQDTMKAFFFFLGEAMKKLAPGLKALLGALGGFLERIGPKLPEVAESLSKIFEKVAPVLEDIAVNVFNAFADVLEWMSKLPPPVLTGLILVLGAVALLPNIGGPVASLALLFLSLEKLAKIPKIGGFLTKLGGGLKKLVPVLKGLGKGFGIAGLVTFADVVLPEADPKKVAEGDIFANQRQDISDYADFVTGIFTDPVGEIRKQIDDIIGEFNTFPAMFDKSPFMQFWRGIGTWWDTNVVPEWNKSLAKLTDGAEWKRQWDAAVDKLPQPVKDAWNGFWTWWDVTVAPQWNTAWAKLTSLEEWRKGWEEFTKPLEDAWKTLTTWWDINVTPGWNKFWSDLWTTTDTWWRNTWNNVGTILGAWWAGLIDWWNINIVPGWNTFWDNIFTTATTWWTTTWNTIGQGLADAWNGLTSWWNTYIAPVWDGMWAGIESRVAGAVNAIGDAWADIQNLLKDPVNWVIDHVWNEAFGGLWNAANGILGGALGAFQPAARVGAAPVAPQFVSGNRTGASTFGLAQGGVIPGYRPGRDSVPAMLSPGEAVMRPEWARAIGTGDINKMNKIARKRGRAGIWNYLYGGDPDGPGLLARRGRASPPMPGFAEGGVVTDDAAIKRAQEFARGMHGTRYQMAGFGRGGIDCTAFLSAITNVLLNRAPFSERFASGAFGGGRSVWGFTPGLTSAWSIGVLPGSPGHAAGTLGGINVESSSPEGARYGGNAMGANNNYFPYKFSLPQVGGIFVGGPGGGSMDIGALVQGWFDQFLKPVRDSIGGAFGGKTTGLYGLPGGFIDTLIKGATTFIMSKASALFGGAAMGATSAETPGIVKIISDVARGRFGANALQAAVIGVATGIVESNLQNLNRGDRDSLGVFQQRPSQGWGTPAQVTNVTYAAGKFFEKFPGNWMGWEPGALAQSIQRSAFGWKYAPQMGRARQLVGQFGGFDSGGVLPPGLTLAFNGTNKPERVLTDAQWQTLAGAAQGGDFRIRSGQLEIVGDGLARIVDARLERVGTSVAHGRRV